MSHYSIVQAEKVSFSIAEEWEGMYITMHKTDGTGTVVNFKLDGEIELANVDNKGAWVNKKIWRADA